VNYPLQARFTEDKLLLPDACAPNTAEKMAAITVIYPGTCSPPAGATSCGANQASVQYAALDALMFDLDYELGGPGGTPWANFVATSGTTTVSADATFGDTTTVSNYTVT
jgi:hypothetical protein